MQKVQLVPIHKVDELWPLVLPLLTKSLEHSGGLPIDQLMTGCRSGYYYLFVAPKEEAAAVCGFIQGSDEFKMLAMGANGDFMKTLDDIKEFAKANGAKRLTFEGRKGWARKMNIQPKSYFYEVSL